MPNITLRNVCKRYDGTSYAVKDFNLDIQDKEFVIFVGPSGCGKSTTIREASISQNIFLILLKFYIRSGDSL